MFLSGCARGMYSYEQLHAYARGGSVTDAGNPAVRTPIEISSLSNTSLKSINMCIAQIRAFPADGSGPLNAVIYSSEISLRSDARVPLGYAQFKNQPYDRFEVLLRSGCSLDRGMALTNRLGSFSTREPVKLVFKGAFQPTGAVARLALGDIENALSAVSSDAAVKPAAEGSTGQVITIPPIQFVQSQTGMSLTPSTVITPAFPQEVTGGNRVVCSLDYDASSTIAFINDTLSTPYTVLQVSTFGGRSVATLLSDPLPATSAGFNVLVSIGTPTSTSYLSCQEYSGISTLSPVLVSVPGSGSDFMSFSPLLTSYGNALYHASLVLNGPGQEQTAGTTLRSINGGLSVADRLLRLPGSVTPVVSADPTTSWTVVYTIFNGQ